MGFVLLGLLSALAVAAALAVTARARPRGRAEGLIATTMLWNLIIAAPIYSLGLCGRLTATTVALGSLLTSFATIAAAGYRQDPRQLARRCRDIFLGQLRLPVDALALTWRARSLVFVGVAFAAVLLPYLAVSAYLGQQVPHWDPLWYHDPMVGFTIQNHGFAMVDLPMTLQKINGYVRLGEMTQLWMVIFTDRRLADITNLLFAPMIIASVYVLARRYTSAVIAVGWGVATVLMPACANLLQSTYVDPQNAALLLGGIVFATVDSPRLRDAWLAALGLALAIGSKGISLIPVPIAGVVGAVALLRTHWSWRRRAAIATIMGGMLVIGGTAAITYVRNYLTFHNPFWPDMRVDIQALGIHWPGQMAWERAPGAERVDMNEPFVSLMRHLTAIPFSVHGMYFDQTVDYGIGVVWIALPIGAIAFVACLVQALRRAAAWAARRARAAKGEVGDPEVPADDDRAPPLGIAIILASMVAGSPALWGPRYHIAAVGLVGVLAAWLVGRPPRDRLGESAIGGVLVMSLMMFYWTPSPHWCFSPDDLLKLARRPAIEREVDRDLRAPTLKAVGLAREKELVPGSLVVFNDRYGAFPSLFWNNTFSNRVMYLKTGADFFTRAVRAGATWAVVASAGEIALARQPGSGWQEVGQLNPINGGTAFRRAPPGSAAAVAPKPAAPPPAKPAPPPPPPPPPTAKPPLAPPTAKSSLVPPTPVKIAPPATPAAPAVPRPPKPTPSGKAPTDPKRIKKPTRPVPAPARPAAEAPAPAKAAATPPGAGP